MLAANLPAQSKQTTIDPTNKDLLKLSPRIKTSLPSPFFAHSTFYTPPVYSLSGSGFRAVCRPQRLPSRTRTEIGVHGTADILREPQTTRLILPENPEQRLWRIGSVPVAYSARTCTASDFARDTKGVKYYCHRRFSGRRNFIFCPHHWSSFVDWETTVKNELDKYQENSGKAAFARAFLKTIGRLPTDKEVRVADDFEWTKTANGTSVIAPIPSNNKWYPDRYPALKKTLSPLNFSRKN